MSDAIYEILSWGAFLVGLIAAGFWWKASRIVIEKGDPRAMDDFFIGEVAVRSTLSLQSRYNQYAAGATALSVLLLALIPAERELAKFRSPRASILEGHDGEIVRALSKFGGTKFDCAMGANKSEQLEFWRALEPMLVLSGWEHITWTNGHTVPLGPYNSPTAGGQPLCGPAFASDVEIHATPKDPPSVADAAQALLLALNNLGITATASEASTESVTKSTVHILIGDKR